MSTDKRTLAGTQMTQDERKARGRKGYLTGAVNTIIRRAGELSASQRESLLAALSATA